MACSTCSHVTSCWGEVARPPAARTSAAANPPVLPLLAWNDRPSSDRHNGAMQFSPELRDRVADGTITVSYRLWSKPKVKVGGIYRSGSVTIEVDDIEILPFSSITDEDLACTGETDLETLRRRAAHAGPIHDDTPLYRVEFHVVVSAES